MCGIIGVSLPHQRTDAVRLVVDGLHAQQHRGQDATGIAVADGLNVYGTKKLGLVGQAYDSDWVASQNAAHAIGHVRYATQGRVSLENAQPHGAVTKHGLLAVASNGDFDAPILDRERSRLESTGVIFVSDNDGEVIAWFLADAYDRTGSMLLAIRELMEAMPGAFSVVMVFQNELWAFRDPRGFRPLSRAVLPDGGVAFASETIAFDLLLADSATYEEVPAGAVLRVSFGRVTVLNDGHAAPSPCAFDEIYFARPDSLVYGIPVTLTRRRIGWQLGLEVSGIPLGDDTIVCPVPDSSNEIARGVAEALRLKYVEALRRSHYVFRTFIENDQSYRDASVRLKLNPDRYLLEGRRVILVDDSIVRGTTILKIVRMLRRAGAASVHVLIGSPPYRWPCFMGIATPTKDELVASQHSVLQIAFDSEADSLQYLSLEGLQRALGHLNGHERDQFGTHLFPLITARDGTYLAAVRDRVARRSGAAHCFACFTGRYPLPSVSVEGAECIPVSFPTPKAVE